MLICYVISMIYELYILSINFNNITVGRKVDKGIEVIPLRTPLVSTAKKRKMESVFLRIRLRNKLITENPSPSDHHHPIFLRQRHARRVPPLLRQPPARLPPVAAVVAARREVPDPPRASAVAAGLQERPVAEERPGGAPRVGVQPHGPDLVARDVVLHRVGVAAWVGRVVARGSAPQPAAEAAAEAVPRRARLGLVEDDDGVAVSERHVHGHNSHVV